MRSYWIVVFIIAQDDGAHRLFSITFPTNMCTLHTVYSPDVSAFGRSRFSPTKNCPRNFLLPLLPPPSITREPENPLARNNARVHVPEIPVETLRPIRRCLGGFMDGATAVVETPLPTVTVRWSRDRVTRNGTYGTRNSTRDSQNSGFQLEIDRMSEWSLRRSNGNGVLASSRNYSPTLFFSDDMLYKICEIICKQCGLKVDTLESSNARYITYIIRFLFKQKK